MSLEFFRAELITIGSRKDPELGLLRRAVMNQLAYRSGEK